MEPARVTVITAMESAEPTPNRPEASTPPRRLPQLVRNLAPTLDDLPPPPTGPRPEFKFTQAKFTPVNDGSGVPITVHEILRESLAKVEASTPKKPEPPPFRSHRTRDYWTLVICGNVVTAAIVLIVWNPITLIFGLSFMVLLTLGLTWIMWFIMEDY